MINNKNIIIGFLADWRIWALIILGAYSLFSVSKLNKSMTHIVCNSSSCQVKDYNSRGTLEHFSEFPISECKSFGIEEKDQKVLNLLDRLSYRESARRSYRAYESYRNEYKDTYFKYTITCTNKDGLAHPIFKTYIRNKENAQNFANILGNELSKENPAVDMEFKESL